MKIFKALLTVVLLAGCVSVCHGLEINIPGTSPAKIPGQIPSSSTQDTIKAKDALKFAGQQKTVCGMIAGAHYETRSQGHLTLLDIDKPYPSQVFTVLIWDSDRVKFEKPLETCSGKEICVTGVIKCDQGRPEMVVKDPAQIKIK